jgi:hypothetical protein
VPQLPASNSSSSQRLNLNSSLTHSTTLTITELILDLFSSKYLGADRTENTVPLLLFNCCLAERAENTIRLLFAGHYIAMTIVLFVLLSLPSNGYIFHIILFASIWMKDLKTAVI